VKGRKGMSIENEDFHPIFDLVAVKSERLSRAITCFRTSDGIEISILIFPDGAVKISASKISSEEVKLTETYRLLPDGSCENVIEITASSINGETWHHLRECLRWTREETLDVRANPITNRVKGQLDSMVQWLQDEKTVRVSPLNVNKILPSGPCEDDIAGLKFIKRIRERSS
jgi:hypothetical protein